MSSTGVLRQTPAFLHTHTHNHIHTHTHSRTNTNPFFQTHAPKRWCRLTFHLCLPPLQHTHTHTHTHTKSHTYTHTHSDTHPHIHTRMCREIMARPSILMLLIYIRHTGRV